LVLGLVNIIKMNKFNIPVLYNSEIVEGNYIDHYPYNYNDNIIKRRVISKDDDILIEFGISILILNKYNEE
jgi:hypothetical protein